MFSGQGRENWCGCVCLGPLYKRRRECCMVRRADGPLSRRRSWRSMDTSVSRAPKRQPPLSSVTPSGMAEGREGVRDASSLRRSSAVLSIPPGREFQWVSQLPISGVLDRATLRQMTLPRCGVADTDSHATWTQRISALLAGHRAKKRRKKRFAKPGECFEFQLVSGRAYDQKSS